MEEIIMSNRLKNLEIEGAQIVLKNFKGAADKFTPAGKRRFCVLIDENMVEPLKADGWNIKYFKPKDENDEPQAYLQVEARFDNYPPRIIMMNTSGKKVNLDEESVGVLDSAEIIETDLIISPSYWEIPGKDGIKSGIKAYLNTMYVTIQEDRFAAKYELVED